MEHSKSKQYIPIMIDVHSLHWIVIGGGNIASRKVETLIKQGASSLTVVAKEMSDTIISYAEQGLIEIIVDEYKLNYLQNKHIVYAATEDIILNREICRDAKLLSLLVCNISEQEQGNYISPSFFQRDDLIFSVSSQGKSPIMSKLLADQWAKQIDDEVVAHLPLLEKLRQDLKRDIESGTLRQHIMREATPQVLSGQVTDYVAWYKSLLKHNC